MREWKKALKEEVSLNCATQCQGCGANKYGVGICTAERCVVADGSSTTDKADTDCVNTDSVEGGN